MITTAGMCVSQDYAAFVGGKYKVLRQHTLIICMQLLLHLVHLLLIFSDGLVAL